MAEPPPKPAEATREAGVGRRAVPSVIEWAIIILAGLFALGLALLLAHIIFNFQIRPA